MKQIIKFTLPADMQHSSLVRRISEEIFEHVGFDSEWSDRLKLVVDELFMNANQYGSLPKGGSVYITFSFDDQEVVFTVEDEGGQSKMNAEQVRQKIGKNLDEMGDPTKTSGRGLALISNLWTDQMHIEDSSHGGIAITFVKKISNDTPPALPIFNQSNH